MAKIDREATIRLVSCAMAVVEMDSPSKREYLKFMCDKHNVHLESFLEEIEAMVRDYEYQLSRPPKNKHGVNQGGFQR